MAATNKKTTRRTAPTKAASKKATKNKKERKARGPSFHYLTTLLVGTKGGIDAGIKALRGVIIGADGEPQVPKATVSKILATCESLNRKDAADALSALMDEVYPGGHRGRKAPEVGSTNEYTAACPKAGKDEDGNELFAALGFRVDCRPLFPDVEGGEDVKRKVKATFKPDVIEIRRA